ncbi:hypothetical protein [Rhizobium leucaenae]|uniref:Toxic anion resistance protein n=1 Tax=Rhizobium leucaenae TaxID=29450 RepID=A0A7W6ZXT4_9HYPH|nr:hypothetical protein [Rhizobium leucaenae]MBB4570743.1 hypothetical protein [Rhizobium leucaenae]
MKEPDAVAPGDDDGDPLRKASPKILFGERAPTEEADPENPGGKPRVLFGSARQPAAKGTLPRIVAGGEARRRIECNISRLREIEPDAAEAVLRNAIRLVEGTNLDDHHFDDVVRFGASLQENYGRLADEQLALAGDDTLATVKRLSGDLLQHLDQLDPALVFAPQRGIGGILRAITLREDPQTLFARRYGEIVEITRELKDRLPEISRLLDTINSLRNKYKSLENGLAAHVLAARFLVRHIATHTYENSVVEKHYTAQADALEARIAALSATAASVAIGHQMINSIHIVVAGTERFASDLINEELPAWKTTYSAALMARASDAHAAATNLPRLKQIHIRLRNTLAMKDDP